MQWEAYWGVIQAKWLIDHLGKVGRITIKMCLLDTRVESAEFARWEGCI